MHKGDQPLVHLIYMEVKPPMGAAEAAANDGRKEDKP